MKKQMNILIAVLCLAAFLTLIYTQFKPFPLTLDEPNFSSQPAEGENKTAILLNKLKDQIAQKEVPSLLEIRELDKLLREEGEVLQADLQKLLAEIPVEQHADALKDTVQRIIDEQDIIKMDHITVNFTMDTLSLTVPNNQKPLRNLMMELKLFYDTAPFNGDNVGERKASTQLVEKIWQELANDTRGMLIVAGTQYKFISLDQNNRSMHTTGEYRLGSPLANPDTAQLDQAQTIAYDFVLKLDEDPILEDSFKRPRHNHDVVLSKFGVIPDEKELYAEILIYSIRSSEDTEKVIADLPIYAEQLANTLLADAQTKAYLTEKGLEKITVAFDIPWYQHGTENFRISIQ